MLKSTIKVLLVLFLENDGYIPSYSYHVKSNEIQFPCLTQLFHP